MATRATCSAPGCRTRTSGRSSNRASPCDPCAAGPAAPHSNATRWRSRATTWRVLPLSRAPSVRMAGNLLMIGSSGRALSGRMATWANTDAAGTQRDPPGGTQPREPPWAGNHVQNNHLGAATFSCHHAGQRGDLPMIWLPRIGAAVVSLLLAQSAWAEEGTAAPADQCNRGQFRLIVDVGHTAEVPGAMSARGISEYDFNLRLATEIKHKLVDAGFTRTVLLVTAGPGRQSLMKRVALANRLPAQLFLSIHHDSVPSQFKETWEYEGKPHQFSDRFKGHSIFISNENEHPKASL